MVKPLFNNNDNDGIHYHCLKFNSIQLKVDLKKLTDGSVRHQLDVDSELLSSSAKNNVDLIFDCRRIVYK